MNPSVDLKRLTSVRGAASRSRDAATRLPDLAAEHGLLDVAIGTLDSPVGTLLVAVTPRGLVRVAFQDEIRDEVLEELSSRISPRILESARETDEIRRELDQYFARGRTRFDVALDRRLIGSFAKKVLGATARVPFGQTSTYGDIAARIGSPGAARAVGNALGSNPIPIVIPCHRVLRAGGNLGGYGGGIARKERLLQLEGVLAPG